MIALRPWLFAVCHDEEYARVSGLPVRALNLLLAVTTAVTVTIAMRAVGLLLVSALMVVPVATAQQVTRGFRSHHGAGDGARPARRRRRRLGGRRRPTPRPGAIVVLLAIAVVPGRVGRGRRWRWRAACAGRDRRRPPPAGDRNRPRSVLTSLVSATSPVLVTVAG